MKGLGFAEEASATATAGTPSGGGAAASTRDAALASFSMVELQTQRPLAPSRRADEGERAAKTARKRGGCSPRTPPAARLPQKSTDRCLCVPAAWAANRRAALILNAIKAARGRS